MTGRNLLPPAVTAYLDVMSDVLRDVLGDNLVGVYLQGSGAQTDFRASQSDIDILAVTRAPVADRDKEALIAVLDHRALPVPAAGLDLMIVTEAVARRPEPAPPYEFWFSTGANWDLSVDREGRTSEVLVFMETCRTCDRAIHGPEPSKVFAPVPDSLLLASLIDIIAWHRGRILDDFHDPNGVNSVLNASRAWMFAETRVLGSKARGGQWVLDREPDNMLVVDALQVRSGLRHLAASPAETEAYLDRILARCRARLAEESKL